MYCRKDSLARGELRRLSGQRRGKDEEWNLQTGTILGRTRGNGSNSGQSVAGSDLTSNSSDEVTEVLEETTEEEPIVVVEEESTVKKKSVKPANNRVVLEVDAMEALVSQLACRECGEAVKMTVKTVCIATSIGIECMNEDCGYIFHPPAPAGTSIHLARGDNFERSTDYAINVLFVLGFLSMGDGCTEAARLLGLMGLPNDTTMKGRSFGIIEDRIGPVIRELCDETILENLMEEAQLAMASSDGHHDEHDYKVWKDSLTDKTIKLSLAKMPKVHGSYDMAWQQKGSGHQYNSASGHGTIVGRRTRKVIALVVKCKTCIACTTWEKKHPGLPIIQHACYKNHEGSSGSMEAAGIVDVVVELFEKRQVIVEILCCDDDSSLRADCSWSNADYLINNNTDQLPLVPKKVGKNKGVLHPRPDKGKLPGHVPEPRFVADPNHRRKTLTGELIKLDTAKASLKFTMTRMDSMRLGKNFGYMARGLRNRPQCEWIPAANAVLEHHFDVHDQCSSDWCPRKTETMEQRKASNKYYRSKEKDAKLYCHLVEKMSRFVTMDKLEEMAHDMDTNMNEGFNNICTWFAPKNKVFAGSASLFNRISFAVCINSLGVLPFYTKLFRKLGITMTENVEHYLRVREDARIRQIQGGKTQDAKKERNKNKYLKLQQHTRTAKMEFLKRAGVYRSGMNMDDPFGELLNGQEDTRKPAAKRQKTNSIQYCEYCGKSDHLTKRSSKCTARLEVAPQRKFRRIDGSSLSDPPAPINVANIPVGPVVATDLRLTDAARDVDRLDSLPFETQMDSDDESFYSMAAEFPEEEEDEGDDDDSVRLVCAAI
jgi:hypothetical protein